MIIKHFVIKVVPFWNRIYYDFIENCSSLTQCRTSHYKMQLIFDFKGA